MRILHVIESLDPSTGGTGAVATRLAAAQAGQGQDVRILSYAGTEAKARIVLSLARVPHADRIDLHYLAPPTLAERFCALQGRAELQRLLADAEVLHLHGVWGALLRVAAKDARRRQRPYFLCPSGMLDPWSLAQRRWKKRLALVCGYRAMLNGAAALHLLNEDEQRLIQPLRLRAPQIILPNGVFLEEIEPLPSPGTFYGATRSWKRTLSFCSLAAYITKKGSIIWPAPLRFSPRRIPEPTWWLPVPTAGLSSRSSATSSGRGSNRASTSSGPFTGRPNSRPWETLPAFACPVARRDSAWLSWSAGLSLAGDYLPGLPFPGGRDGRCRRNRGAGNEGSSWCVRPSVRRREHPQADGCSRPETRRSALRLAKSC